MEYLPRGGYGAVTNNGIYLSWRLLGTEPVNQTFDIYRNDSKTPIVSDLDATNYTDAQGTAEDTYKIVPHGGEGIKNDVFKPLTAVSNADKYAYKDVILDKPDGTDEYSYVVRDVSVGDVDNDGEYEFFIKWNPSNYKDNSENGYTGNVYIDCYKQSGKRLWRIDLGKNIRAGAHYTQFIVYDFDGDGKAEMALRTAPGSKDGKLSECALYKQGCTGTFRRSVRRLARGGMLR